MVSPDDVTPGYPVEVAPLPTKASTPMQFAQNYQVPETQYAMPDMVPGRFTEADKLAIKESYPAAN